VSNWATVLFHHYSMTPHNGVQTYEVVLCMYGQQYAPGLVLVQYLSEYDISTLLY